jgi:hypothetical protein
MLPPEEAAAAAGVAGPVALPSVLLDLCWERMDAAVAAGAPCSAACVRMLHWLLKI